MTSPILLCRFQWAPGPALAKIYFFRVVLALRKNLCIQQSPPLKLFLLPNLEMSRNSSSKSVLTARGWGGGRVELPTRRFFSTRAPRVGISQWFAGVHGIPRCQNSSRKSTHEVIVSEVGLTPVKTNKKNILTLQLLEGKKMLLLGMLVLFPDKEMARKHQQNTCSLTHSVMHCAREIWTSNIANQKYWIYGKLC